MARDPVLLAMLLVPVIPLVRLDAQDVAFADARPHVLRLNESFQHLLAGLQRRSGRLPAAFRDVPPVLGDLSRAVGEQPSAELYRASLARLEEIIAAGDREMEPLIEPESASDDAGDGGEDEEPLDDAAEGLLGHWDNVKYHAMKLHFVESVSRDENQIRVGPVGPADGDRARRALDAFAGSAAALQQALSASNPEMMYRNLFLTQLEGMKEPVARIRSALGTSPPWWTPDAFRSVSDVLRLHRVTRNQLRKMTPANLERYETFTRDLHGLVEALDPIERGVRKHSGSVQIVYEPPPEGP